MRKAINFNGRDFNAVMVETILDIYNTKVLTLNNLEKYQRRVMFCKEYRFIFDVTNLEGVRMGEVKVQKKGDNGRYADMCTYDTDSAMAFERFLENTFDVMIDTDGKVLTEEERMVVQRAKSIAKGMGFDFYEGVGEYLVSAENDSIYTVNVEFRHNGGITISKFFDGLLCTNLGEPFDWFDEEDYINDLKEAINEVAQSALKDLVSYLNDDCDDCIVDTFDTNADELGVDFRDREKSDAVLFYYDKEIKSIVIRDYNGDDKLTTFCNFVEDFTEFCREKLGEDYTENWFYTA